MASSPWSKVNSISIVRPNPILQVYITEKAAALLVVAAHRHPSSPFRESRHDNAPASLLNSLLVPVRECARVDHPLLAVCVILDSILRRIAIHRKQTNN